MSEENVEIMRRVWDAYAKLDIETILSLTDPQAEFVTTHFAGWPEEEVYRGLDGVRRFFEQWLGVWETFDAGVDEFLDLGDRVLVLCWQRGKGGESGVPAEMQFASIFTLREGRIVYVDNFSDREQALEAAGLSE
jgi:ketosteroid isomerase-like protein